MPEARYEIRMCDREMRNNALNVLDPTKEWHILFREPIGIGGWLTS